MLSARNIHFTFLGIILGASIAYALAFYQAQAAMPSAVQAGLPSDHPDLSNDEAISSLKKMVDENPGNTQILSRYANAVLRAGRFDEATAIYRRLVSLDPGDLEMRSLLATLLWRSGAMDEASQEVEKALTQNPKHLPSLHVKMLITLDGHHDADKANQIFQTMEKLDSNYQGLPALRERLDEERGKTRK